MKKILITGGTGFIGEEIIKTIKEPAIVVSRKKIKSPYKNITFVQGNIANKNFISELVKKSNKILHMAAIINPNSQEIYNVNVLSTRYLVNEAKKNNIKKFVYISSENVFCKEKDNYSSTKLEAEKIVSTIKNSVILRPTTVYGKKDKKYLGKFLAIIKKLPVVPLIGNGVFQPIYVKDLAKYVNKALSNHKINGKYVLAGADKITFKEFIKKIQKTINVKKPIITIPVFCILPFVWIYQKLVKNPFITMSQIKNLSSKRTYDISKTIKDFKLKPTPLEQALSESL